MLVPIVASAVLIDGPDETSDAAAYSLIAASIVGPGLGHVYAGESGRFWRGAAVRTLAWGAVVALTATSSNGSEENDFDILAVGAGAIYLYSAIRDVVQASDSVDLYNEKVRSGGVSLAPVWRMRDRAVGMTVAVGF